MSNIARRPAKREAQIKVRLTVEEHREIEELAVARGLNSGACLLRSLFAAERVRLRKQRLHA
jgi:hypothetical protein